MAKIIAIAGEKGGTGKSTVAHLIGHGAGSLPHPIDAIVITTDAGDELVSQPRRYGAIDGRNLALLPDMLGTLDKTERLLIIIDGAAARPELDALIQKVADLVILPYGPSVQDVSRVVRDLVRMPEALALPNRWPTHPGTANRAAQFLTAIDDNRRLPALEALPRVDELLGDTGYRTVATPLSRRAQKLVIEALHRIKVHPLDIASKNI